MKGERVPDGDMLGPACFRAGAYGRVDVQGTMVWYACTPNGHLGNLADHEVTEHEDGTISVEPSIQTMGGKDMAEELWHGYLRRGVWESC